MRYKVAHPAVLGKMQLAAAVFTTDAEADNSQSTFGVARGRRLSVCVYLLGDDAPSGFRENLVGASEMVRRAMKTAAFSKRPYSATPAAERLKGCGPSFGKCFV